MVFTDPEAYQPMMKFFDIAAPWVSQDAPGLKEASLTFFKQNVLKSALAKLFFLLSDGASVNIGAELKLIRLFQEEDNRWV